MCGKHLLLAFLFAVSAVQKGSGQILTHNINLANLLLMQQGLGWPHELHVAEGHEALLKLANNLVNQQSCEISTPAGVTFNVQQPPSSKYESWSDGCGVRVRNITKLDEGRWRLTSSRGNESLTGWSEVHVVDKIPQYTGSPISLQDGASTQVELTSLDNAYCLVSQPFTESSLVPGHCRVTLDKATRAVQGNWNVLLGLPGQVEELQVERRVAVEAERLDTGYTHDAARNKVHLYCNILHTQKNITFCRFQKMSETIGYNIMDGLSDGVHSYYGDGFPKRHCGMTIETPTSQAFGTWRCTVGVQERVGTTIHQRTPLQALIRVASFNTDSRIRRNFEANEATTRTLFVQRESSFTVMCRADVSLTYCWFQHPNGSDYTPMDRAESANQQYWYAGESLQTGDCGITFSVATDNENGDWTCHMGPRDTLGLELTDKVNVRVTGPLAANVKDVNATRGGNITLHCHSSNGNRPLDYCRFLSPEFVGISLDSSVTQENAILDRFYFTPGKGLDYGDCSLTINPVYEEDEGVWTCAALLHDETVESRDTIHLRIDAEAPIHMPAFRADIAGMAGGAVVLFFVLTGVLWYNRDKISRRLRTSSRASLAMSMNDLRSVSSLGRISGVSAASTACSTSLSEECSIDTDTQTVRHRAN